LLVFLCNQLGQKVIIKPFELITPLIPFTELFFYITAAKEKELGKPLTHQAPAR
jgi:hypothetical protein